MSCLAQQGNPEEVVQQQLDTYNNHNIDGFMSLFGEDVQLYNQADGKLLADGKKEVRRLYANLFDKSPNLHSELKNRMTLGNTVIDHEKITGRMGNDQPIELIVIYELLDQKINRVTVIR
ncbi:MAG: nuclear transport factor 2 family protein [Bacteroidota bacterium]